MPSRQPADMDAPGRVGWHELFAADWEKAWAFYGELFGWQKAQTSTPARSARISCSPPEADHRRHVYQASERASPLLALLLQRRRYRRGEKRVKAGNGQILSGPIEVPGNRWIVQCTDPQGAIFALVGKRSHNGIGYFERACRAGSGTTMRTSNEA